MKVDLMEYLSGVGGRELRGSNGLQWETDCPFCGKSSHLYVALERRIKASGKVTSPGDFVCFKCDARGHFIRLFAELEGLDWKEARKILVLGEDPLPAVRKFTAKSEGSLLPPPPKPEPAPVVAAPEPEKPKDEDGIEVLDPLPPDFTPCWDGKRWRVPSYLMERGIKRRTLDRFGIGYCDFGRYASRIILPVICPNGKSFTSRTIDPEETLRYLAGHGAGRLLFGWQVAEKMPRDLLVVCEGPFDALSIHQAGFPVVAIMGKRFRDEQVSMIRSFGAERIVMMLDGDARKDAIQQARSMGGKDAVWIAADLDAKDANEATIADIQAAVGGCISVEAARSKYLRGTLESLRARLQ